MKITDLTPLTPQQLRRSRIDQRKTRCSQQRTPQASRRIIIERSGIRKEAHDERGGEKEICRGAAGEMGKVKHR
jgi:hypothetical protein